MTDLQFKKIIEMFDMILDGCKDLDEARKKIKQLRGESEEKKREEDK